MGMSNIERNRSCSGPGMVERRTAFLYLLTRGSPCPPPLRTTSSGVPTMFTVSDSLDDRSGLDGGLSTSRFPVHVPTFPLLAPGIATERPPTTRQIAEGGSTDTCNVTSSDMGQL